jgi:hypothetical protein
MQVSMALTPNSLARRKPGVQIPSPPPPTQQVRASSASSGRRSLHGAAALRPREQVAVQLGRLSETRRLGPRPHTVTTERSRRLQPELPVRCDARQSRTRSHAGSGRWSSRSRIRQDGQIQTPLLTMWLPRRTDELHELTGADTAGRGRRTRGHRRGTPDIHTRTLDSRRVDIAYADTGRSHRTPDTGHRTRGRDRVRGQGDLDTEGIPDRLPGRSRLPNCPLGRRTVDLWSASSALGDGEVPASARLPTALPGACSVTPSARPSRALAHSSRVLDLDGTSGGQWDEGKLGCTGSGWLGRC